MTLKNTVNRVMICSCRVLWNICVNYFNVQWTGGSSIMCLYCLTYRKKKYILKMVLKILCQPSLDLFHKNMTRYSFCSHSNMSSTFITRFTAKSELQPNFFKIHIVDMQKIKKNSVLYDVTHVFYQNESWVLVSVNEATVVSCNTQV